MRNNFDMIKSRSYEDTFINADYTVSIRENPGKVLDGIKLKSSLPEDRIHKLFRCDTPAKAGKYVED